ncbi:hypothetical protein E1A91_D02G019600v1 [Gossypium mustelinum]|uniref:Uncharacterized protein n=1 Tax=Gossypium mustelinum TaxID=34275 RepID=A0A5D2VQU7_GOSMU|nr:hypothetical protein E1A91_D02G019600v1 [Gossypium mustelinum]
MKLHPVHSKAKLKQGSPHLLQFGYNTSPSIFGVEKNWVFMSYTCVSTRCKSNYTSKAYTFRPVTTYYTPKYFV